MSGFSAQWLDLREPVDHRSRNVELGHRLARHFEGWRPITIVDLGCGTGSNLRATAPLLGPDQMLDAGRLRPGAARCRGRASDRLGRRRRQQDNRLILFKGAKRLSVEFRRADIAGDLDGALGADRQSRHGVGLLRPRLGRFHRPLRRRRGQAQGRLLHRADLRRRSALDARARGRRRHGRGLPRPSGARQGLRRRRRPACTRTCWARPSPMPATAWTKPDSAWRLGDDDALLIADLARGFADAVRETGQVDAQLIADWSAITAHRRRRRPHRHAGPAACVAVIPEWRQHISVTYLVLVTGIHRAACPALADVLGIPGTRPGMTGYERLPAAGSMRISTPSLRMK